MIVTLKTLQEDTFTVEIDPSQTVRYFKEKIEKVKGPDFPAKNMKLMYAGKFLIDSNRVRDYNVEEKKFVIVVIKQPRKPIIKEEEPDPDDPFVNGSNSSAERDRARAEHERLVHHIGELGFSRGEVERALHASYNNPDRAVEYLFSGVCSDSSDMNGSRNSDNLPVGSDANLLRHLTRTGPPSPRSAILPSQERIFELFSEAMTECENHTRAQDRMVEADHERITQSYAEMEAAGITNPLGALGGSIGRMNNPFDPSGSMPSEPLPNLFPGAEEYFDVFHDAFSGPGGIGLSGGLLDRDHEAIERLKSLGFSDHKVIEAYFVCEKNENAAADYLFSQKFE